MPVEGVEDLSFRPAGVDGAFEIDGTRRTDERGHFARVWCERLFAARGLAGRFAQVNTGVSNRAGTLRGMHYQLAPHAEVKLVRCVRGAVFDVAVDLRPGSPTFGRWHALELHESESLALLMPPGVAHGFQALSDDAHLLYQHSAAFAPDLQDGVRHDDMPVNQSDFHHAKPIYEELPGWWEDISRCRTFEELPENARRYVLRVEVLIGARVSAIGVGPGRDEIIERHPLNPKTNQRT